MSTAMYHYKINEVDIGLWNSNLGFSGNCDMTYILLSNLEIQTLKYAYFMRQ